MSKAQPPKTPDKGLPLNDFITREEFEVYKKATLDNIKEIHERIEKNSVKTEELKEGIRPLAENVESLSEGIDILCEQTETLGHLVEEGLEAEIKTITEEFSAQPISPCLPIWVKFVLFIVFLTFVLTGGLFLILNNLEG